MGDSYISAQLDIFRVTMTLKLKFRMYWKLLGFHLLFLLVLLYKTMFVTARKIGLGYGFSYLAVLSRSSYVCRPSLCPCLELHYSSHLWPYPHEISHGSWGYGQNRSVLFLEINAKYLEIEVDQKILKLRINEHGHGRRRK